MNEYLNSINPQEQDSVIKQILAQAKELNTPIIQNDAINLLIQLLKIKEAKNVLEIGSAIGYSSIMLAKYAGVNVLTLEKDTNSYNIALQNIKLANLEAKIKIVNTDALEYEISEDYRCDLLFIDAAKAQYIKFLEKYEKYLNPKGIVISDNLLFHGMVENIKNVESRNTKQLVRKINTFNEYIVNNPNYETYIYEIGDGISISIKK